MKSSFQRHISGEYYKAVAVSPFFVSIPKKIQITEHFEDRILNKQGQ